MSLALLCRTRSNDNFEEMIFPIRWVGVIKPCPFCGFKLDIHNNDCIYPINIERTIWTINCYVLGGGCDASLLGDCPGDCIEKWNRRVGDEKEVTNRDDLWRP
jgi:hypothetical protein